MNTKIPYGYCHCGCGEKTNIAKCTDKRFNWIKGEPVKYIKGHFTRVFLKTSEHPAKGKTKQFCKRGHERIAENITSKGQCKLCAVEYEKQRIRKHDPNYVRKNKEERKQQTAKWAANNKEKLKESKAKWYKDNIEHCKQYRRKYYRNNSVKIKIRSRVWALKHPEQVKTNRLKHYINHPNDGSYYASNRERCIANAAKWARNNRDKVNARNHKYIENMPNWYLAHVLKVPVSKCTQELLEIKKLTITLRRSLK